MLNFIKKLVGLFIITCLFITNPLAANITITGAGATFPYPIYAKWAEFYQKIAHVNINYQSIGSGGGIKQIEANTIAFGATDKPLSVKQLKQANLIQFPAIIGGVVPIIHLQNIKSNQLRLSGKILADIYLGKIKFWNDPQILQLNPKLLLPKLSITVAHRSDGSGTTFLFTHYLSQVNTEWAKQVSHSTAVAWPTGIGGKGNEGVAVYIQKVNGAIGYVEYAYAKESKLTMILLQNKSGTYVQANIDSFTAAAKNATWNKASQFNEILTNQSGEASWPIVGASFILLHKTQTYPIRAKEILNFFNWAFNHGQEMAKQLDYVPLPVSVILQIQNMWQTEIVDKNGHSIWH
jgi:phosphate transport system substrate-binding protein